MCAANVGRQLYRLRLLENARGLGSIDPLQLTVIIFGKTDGYTNMAVVVCFLEITASRRPQS